MIRVFRNVCLLFILSTLAACVGIETAGPGPFAVQKSYQVTLNKEWTVYPYDSRTGLQGLTIDGVSLNSLTFGVNIKDGKALLYSSDPKKLVPRFRADMTDSEVAEFIKDSLTFSGMKNVALNNLRREPFGTLSGTRFDISGDTERGLNMSGTVKTVIRDGELQLILFIAPTEYYFNLHIDDVNKALDSAVLL